MKVTKTLKELSLSSSQIYQVDCLRDIFLNNSQLEILDLIDTEIRNEGLKEICNYLKATKSIKKLYLSHNYISKVDCLGEVLFINSQLE